MRIRNLISFFTLCLLLPSGIDAITPSDNSIEKIKENYREILIPVSGKTDSLTRDLVTITPETEMSDQVVIELHERYPFDMAKIEAYLSKLMEDGSWSDINYEDTKRSGWEPKQHADRVLEMVKLYKTPGSPLCQSAELKRQIHRALGYWFTAKPKCLNWWQNEIGVPKTLGPACILIEDELTAAERAAIEEVMSAARIKMTGQNKVWLSGNVLIRGLIQNDSELVKMARDTIASEICVGRAEGIKSDWSFHQHGPQQQFGNYGLAFLSGMGFYYKLFKVTPFEFDREQEEILRSFINEGYKWTIWKRRMDISALGRQLFHNAQLHKAYTLAFTAADFGIDGFPTDSNPLVGHKHFHESDYTVHRTPSWMATLKMSSSRVIGTEVVNEDNLLGYYLGDGATYYYVRGDEYGDVFPFWDWRKIPGVTSYEDTAPIPNIRKNKSRNRSALVGGLGYGRNGMSAMAFDRDSLTARKVWVFTDDFVLCLGGAIHSDSLRNVTTTIDSRTQRGSLYRLSHGKWNEVKGPHEYNVAVKNPERFYHDSTGYVILSGAPLHVSAEHRFGSWNSFMKMYKPAEIEGDVVTLYLSHGIAPTDGGYAYFVLPASGMEKVAGFRYDRHVGIICNDSQAQIVELKGAAPQIWIAAYSVQPLTVNGETFTPSAPGIYCLEKVGKKFKVKESTYFKQ